MQFRSLTPNVMVEDVNETVEYYKNMLGFELLMSVPEEGQLNWAYMKRDNTEMMFQSRESITEELPELGEQEIGGTLAFFIKVQNIHDLYENIRNKVNVIIEMHTTFYKMYEFTIRDCNGYILTFAEEAS